ncbi:site-2 protease family protein [Amycolatopsis samaneae]|uniref:Zinc metalloprotease n=1 Tax=Amycolatopsis samaneae TaxID=664691 RepID=A0ABW5GRD2_9PSEU
MSRTVIPLGRWAGVAIDVHWSVLVAFALLTGSLATDLLRRTVPDQDMAAYWVVAVIIAVGFLASLLAHELAHALAARREGAQVRRITLWMLGGTTELDGEPANPRTELLVAVAGPIASLVCGGAGLGAAFALRGPAIPLVVAGLGWFGLTNVVLGVFNLLPGAPLDGGRILHAVLWHRSGDRARAAEIATRAGTGVGLLVVAIGVGDLLFGSFSGLWLVFAGVFLLAAAQAELAGSPARDRLGDLPVGAIMDPAPDTAPEWLTIEAFLDQVTPGTRRRVFPVVSFEGHPVGVISLAELTQVAPRERRFTRVTDVCRATPGASIVDIGTPVAELLSKTTLRRGRDLAMVVRDGRLTGVVDADDLTRAVELALLGRSTYADH